MSKELELAKKMAVLGWLFRNELITAEEYRRTKSKIIGKDKIYF